MANGKGSHKGRIAESMKQYGFDKHTFEIVEMCSVDKLPEREKHYQQFYQSIGTNGLNTNRTLVKNEVFQFRCTKAFKERLVKAAGKKGITISQYLEEAMMQMIADNKAATTVIQPQEPQVKNINHLSGWEKLKRFRNSGQIQDFKQFRPWYQG